MAPIPRGLIGRWVDQLFAYRNSLIPELCSYTREAVRIPVKDGINVVADLYRPTGIKQPRGTILVRTPYGYEFPHSLKHARIWAARGYNVLLSSCRGMSGSDGEFEPGRNEKADGLATVQWMRTQDWYTGSFATLGGSYLGFTQWALLSDPPHDMKTAIITTGVDNLGGVSWSPSGTLQAFPIAWADITERVNRKDNVLSILLQVRYMWTRMQPLFDSVPLHGGVKRHFNGNIPKFLEGILSNPDPSTDFMANTDHRGALDRANIPILLTTGWDDFLLGTVVEQYNHLSKRGCKVALTIGPFTHLSCQSYLPPWSEWLERHLDTSSSSEQAIHDVPGFIGRLLNEHSSIPSDSASSSTSWIFDPANPTPSIGSPLAFDNGPGRDGGDGALAKRSDVLTFTTEPLTEDITVCGRPYIELYHTTSTPFADLMILLSDVEPDGFSRTRSEVFVRLTNEVRREYARSDDKGGSYLRLSLSDCGHRFLKGHKIRVSIMGGAHPRYIRNFGTGDNVVMGVKTQKVKHTVKHSSTAVSKLVLPVMD
ncbi:CocE/NonD hydrolase [Xylariaceae sp. FL1272]|nr:CocE/NonD hydrolase [Xylariaceae sp. FL1272]